MTSQRRYPNQMFFAYNNGIADACSGVIDEREMDLDSFFAKYQKIVLENSDEIERSVEDDNYRGDLTDKNKREYTIGFNNTFVEVLELIKPEFVEAFQTWALKEYQVFWGCMSDGTDKH